MEDGGLRALGNSEQLKQVLLNLVVNGMEAIEETGSIRVTAGVGSSVAANGRSGTSDETAISVVDTGVGMERDALTQMFAPFWTTKQSGTGLGLAIVDRLVEAHGGRIEIETTPGSGSRFVIYLPKARD